MGPSPALVFAFNVWLVLTSSIESVVIGLALRAVLRRLLSKAFSIGWRNISIALKMVGQRLCLSTPVDSLGCRLYRQRLRPRELSSAKDTYQPNEDQVNGYDIVQDSRHLLHSRLAFLRWTTHPE
jgi:hypothetical protein